MTPTPKRRRPFLRRVSLLAFLTVSAVTIAAAYQAIRLSNAETARLNYENVLKAHHAQLVVDEDVYLASEEWLDAELRVPFSSVIDATSAHVKRIDDMRDEFIKIMPGYDRDGEGRLASINDLCERARNRLSRAAGNQ